MIARFLGMRKLPEGATPPKADPLAVTITDFAWWLRNSAFDIKPAEVSDADRNKIAGSQVLLALGMTTKEPDRGTEGQPEDAGTAG